MNNMWNIGERVQIITPVKEIIEEQCRSLAELTDNKIIARVSEYDGDDYKSYTKKSALKHIPMNFLDDEIVDPQDALGETGDFNEFVFEFYITSPKTPKYKYRLCFVYYSIALYPVGISIDESIAKSAGLDVAELEIDNEKGFVGLLNSMLSCEKVASIIQNLLILNK